MNSKSLKYPSKINSYLETPILFIIFNSPEETQRVFAKIREVKPKFLYIAADGPRPNKIQRDKKCEATRDIIHQIDWDCEFSTLFRESNLGCKVAVSTAITWFFDNVEAGIILEDDCLPTNSFFFFCQELLERYKDDKSVMMISGDNFHLGKNKPSYSYYFSRYAHIWGWATWRRAWHLFDVDIKLWSHVRNEKILSEIFKRKNLSWFWEKNFQSVYQKELDTWDYQWVFACLVNNGLSIVPEVNLISNIGFNEDATHTKDANNKYANLERHEIQFPLSHPPLVARDTALDSLQDEEMYISNTPSWRNIMKYRFKRRCLEFIRRFYK